ncbi:MAG: ribonuclease HII [Flavobacteriales bacterium]|nr:ribonuclease HII [Flavobacteriales bacterium]MBP9080000.1 ribonuclease HII [Flavobacteriales bacterium]
MPRLATYHTGTLLEAGCDEAGRGCLAGPVVAAAVLLPPGVRLPGLDDSKKLTHRSRERLRPLIEAKALAWCVGVASVGEIDRLNILQASFLAMHRAIAGLALRPQQILVDGNRFMPFEDIPHHCIIQGDAKYRSIAAASVLAKTHRDALMATLHHQHPVYRWNVNQGYPTADHRAALAQHGPCVHHRTSFTLVR